MKDVSLPDLIYRMPVRGRKLKKMCGPPQRARRVQRAKRGTQGGPPRGGASGERQHTNKLTTASRTEMQATKSTSGPQVTELWKNCHLWRARVKAKRRNVRSQSRPLIQCRTPGRAGVLTFLRAPAQPSSKKHSLLYVPEGPTLRRVGTAVAAILRQDVH